MSITTPKTIREKIVNNLVTGPQDTLRTLELLQKTSKNNKTSLLLCPATIITRRDRNKAQGPNKP